MARPTKAVAASGWHMTSQEKQERLAGEQRLKEADCTKASVNRAEEDIQHCGEAAERSGYPQCS